MYNITLLSSFHIELGKCNAEELYKIITEIKPEIIFEELPQALFHTIYAEGYDPHSLEAIAINKYLKEHHVEHIPVDTLEKKEEDMFGGYNIILKKSTEYDKLFKQQLSLISQHGYQFLNGSSCLELMDEMHKVEENVLLEINDAQLLKQYKSDGELQDKRAIAMLQNIYDYSKKHRYDKALFICGAEHRKSMMQKIQEYEKKGQFKLNWTFYGN